MRRRYPKKRPTLIKQLTSLMELKQIDFHFHTTGDTLPLFTLTQYSSNQMEGVGGTGAGFVVLNNLVSGPSPFNRIGCKVTFIKIHFSVTFYLHGASDSTNTLRYALVYDKQPNGTAPLTQEIFCELTSSGSGSLDFNSHPNPLHNERYKILLDRTKDMDSEYNSQVTVQTYLKRLSLNTQYEASANNITDITTGAIYFIAGSEYYADSPVQEAISASDVSIRLTFRDL
jgi:hypothetical protein